MKNHVIFLVLLFVCVYSKGQPVPALPSSCDEEYAQNIQKILMQMRGFANKPRLQDYLNYMIRIKQFDDLNFKLHAIESKISSGVLARKTTVQEYILAKLRTPAQKYNDCRDQRVYHPTAVTPQLCDRTYAALVQAILTELAPTTEPHIMQAYKEYMIMLKHLEDARFKIRAFEHNKNNLSVIATLRAPLTHYLGCRDVIIRAHDTCMRTECRI